MIGFRSITKLIRVTEIVLTTVFIVNDLAIRILSKAPKNLATFLCPVLFLNFSAIRMEIEIHHTFHHLLKPKGFGITALERESDVRWVSDIVLILTDLTIVNNPRPLLILPNGGESILPALT